MTGLGQHFRRALGRVTVHVYPEAIHQIHIDGALSRIGAARLLLGAEQKTSQQFGFGKNRILTEQLNVTFEGDASLLDLAGRQRQQFLGRKCGQGERGQRSAQLFVKTVQLLVAQTAMERAIDVDIEALSMIEVIDEREREGHCCELCGFVAILWSVFYQLFAQTQKHAHKKVCNTVRYSLETLDIIHSIQSHCVRLAWAQTWQA